MPYRHMETAQKPVFTIVLVMLHNMQDYIMDNITHLLQQGNRHVVVLTDAKFVSAFARFGAEIRVEAVEDFYPEYAKHIQEAQQQPRHRFRGGFWFLTSFRFSVLHAFMAHRQLQNVIHLENDVLVYTNLQEMQFHRYDRVLLTMDTFHRAIPGFMFIPNGDILKQCLLRFRATDNDMQNWGRLFHVPGVQQLVDNLPIAMTDATSAVKNFVTQHFPFYNAVFDAAALGQYLGGIDPRNVNHNRSTAGFVNETCVVNYSQFVTEFIQGRPYIYKKDKSDKVKVPVICLHIHSKNLRQFMPPQTSSVASDDNPT